MERIPIRITALLAMTTLAACDFLDIDTPGIVNRDKMFENEQGFIDAMNGVYASMADARPLRRTALVRIRRRNRATLLQRLRSQRDDADQDLRPALPRRRRAPADRRHLVESLQHDRLGQQRAGQHLRTRLRNSAAHPRRSADRARLPAFRPAQTLRAQHRTRATSRRSPTSSISRSPLSNGARCARSTNASSPT